MIFFPKLSQQCTSHQTIRSLRAVPFTTSSIILRKFRQKVHFEFVEIWISNKAVRWNPDRRWSVWRVYHIWCLCHTYCKLNPPVIEEILSDKLCYFAGSLSHHFLKTNSPRVCMNLRICKRKLKDETFEIHLINRYILFMLEFWSCLVNIIWKKNWTCDIHWQYKHVTLKKGSAVAKR